GAAAAQPADRLAVDPFLLLRPGPVPGVHHGAARTITPQSTTGGHRLCWAAIGSPGHSRMASRLSRAGGFSAAGPAANAWSRLVVTRLAKLVARRFMPNVRSPLQQATHRMVPAANTPAPPRWV